MAMVLAACSGVSTVICPISLMASLSVAAFIPDEYLFPKSEYFLVFSIRGATW